MVCPNDGIDYGIMEYSNVVAYQFCWDARVSFVCEGRSDAQLRRRLGHRTIASCSFCHPLLYCTFFCWIPWILWFGTPKHCIQEHLVSFQVFMELSWIIQKLHFGFPATSRFACYCLRILVCLKICCSTWLGHPSVLPGHQRRFSTRPLSWPWFSCDLGHAIGEKIHVNPVNGPHNSCQKCGDCLWCNTGRGTVRPKDIVKRKEFVKACMSYTMVYKAFYTS